eukprot:g13732.t1
MWIVLSKVVKSPLPEPMMRSLLCNIERLQAAINAPMGTDVWRNHRCVRRPLKGTQDRADPGVPFEKVHFNYLPRGGRGILAFN